MRNYRAWPGRDQAAGRGYSAVVSSMAARQATGRAANAARNMSAVAGSRGPRPVSRSPRAAARRRQVLSSLLAVLFLATVLGLVTGSSAAWWVAVVVLPFLSAYIAVLFRNRRLMVEREFNSAFSGPTRRTEATLSELFPEPQPRERLRAVGGRNG